jgi:hypothetical protein
LGGDINRGSRFADPTFLINDGDNFLCHMYSSAYA